MRRRPGLHLGQGVVGFGLRGAEDDEVIGIAHDGMSLCAHLSIQAMQVEVSQQGTGDATDTKGNLSPRRDFDPPQGVWADPPRLDLGHGRGSNGE